jgi:uncharacterized membrane protein
LRSNASFVLAILAALLWAFWEQTQSGLVYWPYLAVWSALVVAVALTTRWPPALHLLALTGSAWIVVLGYVLTHELVVMSGLAILSAGMLGTLWRDATGAVARPASAYGLAIAFAGLFGLQFMDWSFGLGASRWLTASGLSLGVLAAITLTLVLGCLWLGVQRANKPLTWLAYICFTLEIIALYFRTIGTLFDTALFFLFAGVMVIGLAALAWRVHQRHIAVAGALP